MNKKDDDREILLKMQHNPSQSEELVALFGTRYKEVFNRITVLNFQKQRAEYEIEKAKAELDMFPKKAAEDSILLYGEVCEFFSDRQKSKHYKEVRLGRVKYYSLLDFEDDPQSLELIVKVNRLMNYERIRESTYRRSLDTIRWGKRGGIEMIYNVFVKDGIPDTTITRAHNSDLDRVCKDGIDG